MSLSYLPDPPDPDVAIDPEVPAGDRRRLREEQAHLRPSTAPLKRAWTPVVYVLSPLLGRRGRAVRLGRRYRGRYVVGADLDPDAKIVLQRAQSAISTVLESRVNRAGLLDEMDNALTLPREEWEIARALVVQSRLWTEQRELRTSDLTPLQKARFEPQRDALRTAQRAVVKRVQALEEYAERTAAADAAYGPGPETVPAGPAGPATPDRGTVVERFEARDDDYRDVLADTVGHDLATARIAELGQDAAELESALREASRARRRLGPPPA